MSKRKFRIFIIFATAMVFLVGTAHAEEPDNQPKEPRLLKEIEFDKMIKGFGGNVVVTEDSIVFLDEDGNIKKTEKLIKPERTEVILSKCGKRIGQSRAYDVNEKGPGRIEFKMMDEEGNVLWEAVSGLGIKHISEANEEL